MLSGKVVVITGGSQGLGFAIAKRFSKAGAKLVLAARSEDKLTAACKGLGASACVLDLTAEDAPQKLIEHATSAHGRIDILVNSAGVFVWKKFLEMERADWTRTIETNLAAPFHLSQAVAKHMVEAGTQGSILNISSIHGSAPDAGVVPHCASKYGLNGLTQAMAEALREHGIRVNALAPGAIEPESSENESAGLAGKVTQSDIAKMAEFLVSDAAASTTGGVFPVYGSTRTAIKV